MRGTVAKLIRKEVYGDISIYFRKYIRDHNGSCNADDRRKTYQRLKKAYVRGNS